MTANVSSAHSALSDRHKRTIQAPLATENELILTIGRRHERVSLANVLLNAVKRGIDAVR